jgi:CRISPR-associated RAMP protein (TIGR02581 family)
MSSAEKDIFFNEFLNKIVIEGIVETVTGIHIGAGDNSFEPMTVNSVVVKDKNEKPFIPGSSIKGVIRSYLEKILRIPEINDELLREGKSKKNVCTIDNTCLNQILKDKNKKKIYDEKRKKGSDVFSKYLFDELCPICHIFGSGDSSSKVIFRDMNVVDDSFLNYEIRSGILIDRDLNITSDNALFDVEIIPSGTQFEFMMIAENILEIEWQFLKYALTAMENEDIVIGGLKSRGLGHIKLLGKDSQEISGKYIDKKNLKQHILQPKSISYLPLEKISVESQVI